MDDANFKDGVLHVHTPHTTSGIFITEDELLHLVDIRFFLDKVAPKYKEPEGDQKNIKYLHDIISLRNDVPEDEKINGHSHIRRLFFGPNSTIPVWDGELILGDWSSIFFVELDPNRDRKIYLTCLPS